MLRQIKTVIIWTTISIRFACCSTRRERVPDGWVRVSADGAVHPRRVSVRRRQRLWRLERRGGLCRWVSWAQSGVVWVWRVDRWHRLRVHGRHGPRVHGCHRLMVHGCHRPQMGVTDRGLPNDIGVIRVMGRWLKKRREGIRMEIVWKNSILQITGH